MQTFNKINTTEVRSASSLSEGTLKEAMNDCQPKKEKQEIQQKSTQNMCFNPFPNETKIKRFILKVSVMLHCQCELCWCGAC